MPSIKPKIQIVCEVCDIEFEVQPYRVRAGVRFCGRACYEIWRKGKCFYTAPLSLSNSEIVKRYTAGELLKGIADDAGVTTPTIRLILKNHGIAQRPVDPGKILTDPLVQEKAKIANQKRTGAKNHKYVHVPIDEIAKLYKAGETTTALGKQFGVSRNTIARKLRSAGVSLRQRGFSKPRECPDGHIVDSGLEYAVDVWLFEHGIVHNVQPTVPWWNGGRSPQRADFLVRETYIEVWGIEGNQRYDQRRLNKVEKYKACGSPLIQIFPHHVFDGDFSPLETLLE